MTLTAELFVDSRNALGEGPFWHPLRNQLFWFDINACVLFAATADGAIAGSWSFAESVAAAAVIDADRLAIATETGLKRFDLKTGLSEKIVAIEADDASTRANDSRVDRAGGFWIGTMRKAEDAPAGSVYRYRAGRLDTIRRDVEIPNSICFSPDGDIAYFSDTPSKQILQCRLHSETGLPEGGWTLFADVSGHRGHPDGSVVDAEGYLWNARWGGSCVVRHAPDGSVDRIVELPVGQVTCPAFGGPDMKTLYITTANKTMSPEALAREPHAGSVFAIPLDIAGIPELLIVL